MSKLTFRIAGGSGDGIDTTGTSLGKSLMRSGYNVFTHRHYPSRIRGGHTYFEISAGVENLVSRDEKVDVLMALGDSFARSDKDDAFYENEEVLPLVEHMDDLETNSIVIYDSGVIDEEDLEEWDFEETAQEKDWSVHGVDLQDIAKRNGRQVMRNTAAVAYACSLVNFDAENVKEIIRETMSGDVMEQNMEVFDEAYSIASDKKDNSTLELQDVDPHEEEQALINGSQAAAYGALDSGVQFISGYPMTPWTDVFQILCNILPETGGVAEQVEDEIAACCLAIGASHAGAKAMTGSSGGGFSLMSEPLGLAEMTETPLVLVEAMRGGPSTGLPTKPEQGDLEHVLHTSQGDTTRVVLSPGNVQEAYEQTRLSFKLAYDYQLPVVLLLDQKITGEFRNVPADFFRNRDSTAGDLGSTMTEEEIQDAPHHDTGKLARFRKDVDSVSPRSIPGQKDGRFLATGNEHNEYGHICEDPENREELHSRRINKLEDIRDELDKTEWNTQESYGELDESKYGILTFGSQQGVAFDAVDRMDNLGHKCSAMGVSTMKPFPVNEVQDFVDNFETVFVAEMNATAQFKRLLEQKVDVSDLELVSVKKYSGNPLLYTDICESIQEVIKNDN